MNNINYADKIEEQDRTLYVSKENQLEIVKVYDKRYGKYRVNTEKK